MTKCTHEIQSFLPQLPFADTVIAAQLDARMCTGSLHSTSQMIASATVLTAITATAIKGQDSGSLSKIDSNKHLPEVSTNLQRNRRLFECAPALCE